jgi:hypothetical protein
MLGALQRRAGSPGLAGGWGGRSWKGALLPGPVGRVVLTGDEVVRMVEEAPVRPRARLQQGPPRGPSQRGRQRGSHGGRRGPPQSLSHTLLFYPLDTPHSQPRLACLGVASVISWLPPPRTPLSLSHSAPSLAETSPNAVQKQNVRSHTHPCIRLSFLHRSRDGSQVHMRWI